LTPGVADKSNAVRDFNALRSGLPKGAQSVNGTPNPSAKRHAGRIELMGSRSYSLRPF
jgi:hypothetical protein